MAKKAAKHAESPSSVAPAGPAMPAAVLDFDAVMADLARHGTAADAANYRKLGAADPVLGVSFAHLGDLAKSLKPNNPLATQLWTCGTFDAMSLAAMIAEPDGMSDSDLDLWAGHVRSTLICSMFAELAARAEGAADRVTAWTAHTDTGRQACGFATASAALRQAAAGNGPGLTDAVCKSLLARIEQQYAHGSDQLKHAMNLALMAIGGYRSGLRLKATELAEKLAPLGCNVKAGIEALAARGVRTGGTPRAAKKKARSK